ncbi:hypothetical protein RD792_009691 [Penstemon davidsonii]|nr:hypothetical protein RD792_009691 [Penstemon davidsonii]
MQLQMLSPQTKYAAYLVFKLGGDLFPEGINLDCSAKASIKLVKENSAIETKKETNIVYIVTPTAHTNQYTRRRRRSVHATDAIEGRFSQKRLDGWMELELGEFFVGEEDEGEVEMELLETEHVKWKSALFVEGIEIRPRD